MSHYEASIPQFSKMLGNVSRWLDEAANVAEERGFDAEKLATAQIAIDQFDLTRNVQAACDTAKLAGSRLAGIDAPKHEDGLATLAELKARIASVQDYLGTIDAAAFDAGAERQHTPAFLRGQAVMGRDLLVEFSVPNFYFHVSMVYAILRHHGVPLGKRTFLGSMKLFSPE